jgi:MATE family multidrug resistance protein
MLLPRRSDLRELLKLALPVIAVQLGMIAMGVADTIMVGHVSPSALASAALGNLYFQCFGFFGNGILTSLDPLVSQAVGARDHDAIGRAVQRGLVLALGLSAIATLGFLPAGRIFELLSQPADVIPAAARFVMWSIPGLLPWFSFIALRQTLQALGRVGPVLAVVLVANLTNVGLNWVLIYGHLGFPAFGVAGSAMASSVSRWVMALGVVAIGWKSLRPHLMSRHPNVLDPRAFGRMVWIGLPMGGQYVLEYGAFAVTALMMGWLGTVPVAAHQIALNLASVTFMVPLGVSAAGSVLVGRAVGREDAEGARRAAVAALLFGAGFMSLTAITFLAIPEALASLYTPDPRAQALAAVLIPIAGVFQVFDGSQVVCVGVLRGVGDTGAPLAINVLGFWFIGVPVSAALAFYAGLGPRGLWWGLVVGLAVGAGLLVARVWARMRRRMARLVIDSVTSAP